jgi:hypothetical protein
LFEPPVIVGTTVRFQLLDSSTVSTPVFESHVKVLLGSMYSAQLLRFSMACSIASAPCYYACHLHYPHIPCLRVSSFLGELGFVAW